MAFVAVLVVSLLAACSDPSTTPPDGGADDGGIDAPIDPEPGTGQRIFVVAKGMRAPTEIVLAIADGERRLVVTEDAMTRFPGRYGEGTTYAITTADPSCAVVSGSGSIATTDVTAQLFCSGVVELSDIAFSFPSQLTPRFHGGATSYDVARPFLLEPEDLIRVTATAAYPVDATLRVYGSIATSGAPAAAHALGAGPSVALEHASGLARTYTFATATPVLVQEAYLKAPASSAQAFFSGGNTGLGFTAGNALALSGDSLAGPTLVVGAPFEDTTQTNGGRAYVYRRVAASWAVEATLAPSTVATNAKFGSAVAVSGDVAVVGAPDEAPRGAAYVFQRSGGAWTEVARLQSPSSSSGDSFGFAVAISGSTIVVGAMLEDLAGAADGGAAYVFVQSGATWSLQQRLVAPEADIADLFGRAVSISGDTIAIGAPLEDGSASSTQGSPNESATNAGAVYVFVRAGDTWTLQRYLKAPDAAVSNNFGFACAVHGDRLVAGAPGRNQAYTFARAGTAWSTDEILSPVSPRGGERFGSAVAIERNHLVVGAELDSAATRGIDPPHTGTANEAGGAYIYRRTAAGWAQSKYLKSSNSDPLDHFGSSVAIAGDTCAVGAAAEDGSGSGVSPATQSDNATDGAGAVYVFR